MRSLSQYGGNQIELVVPLGLVINKDFNLDYDMYDNDTLDKDYNVIMDDLAEHLYNIMVVKRGKNKSARFTRKKK